jgi:hypothetical protein
MKCSTSVSQNRIERSLQSLTATNQIDRLNRAVRGDVSTQHLPHKTTPYLQITSVPISERIIPSENRYILLIQPHGVRATGGQFKADEAYEIAKATRGWDWSLDRNGRPRCLSRLEELLDRICKDAFKEGEA